MDQSQGVRGRAGRWAMVLLAVIALALLWQQVFAMTGLLWWDAPEEQPAIARPAPPEITPLDKDWVDLEAYLKTHPVWQP